MRSIQNRKRALRTGSVTKCRLLLADTRLNWRQANSRFQTETAWKRELADVALIDNTPNWTYPSLRVSAGKLK